MSVSDKREEILGKIFQSGFYDGLEDDMDELLMALQEEQKDECVEYFDSTDVEFGYELHNAHDAYEPVKRSDGV